MGEWTVKLEPNQKLLHILQISANFGSALVFLIAVISFISWYYKISLFTNYFPHITGMHPLSAIAFMASGAGFLLQLINNKPGLKLVSGVLSSLTIIIGAVSFLSYINLIDIGINQFFFNQRFDLIVISPNSAVTFIFVGVAQLLFLFSSKKLLIRFAQILVLSAAAISMAAIIGYIYQTFSFYEFAKFAPMPLSSAIASAILCISILFAKADRGLTKAITRNTPSSKLAFRLILITLTLPAIAGFIFLQSIKLQLFDLQTGIALLIVLSMILISIIIWLNTSAITELELREIIVNKELKNKNISLEINAKELAAKSISLEEEKDEAYKKISEIRSFQDATDLSN